MIHGNKEAIHKKIGCYSYPLNLDSALDSKGRKLEDADWELSRIAAILRRPIKNIQLWNIKFILNSYLYAYASTSLLTLQIHPFVLLHIINLIKADELLWTFSGHHWRSNINFYYAFNKFLQQLVSTTCVKM